MKKTIGSTNTWFIYDASGQFAAEYGGTAPPETGTHYLTTDHLGSTRLVTRQNNTVVSRHDYLPFGEEIPVNYGGRTTAMGYQANPALTQRFTGKERDTETGLDYFGARYLSSVQGRWASADAPLVFANPENPQTWNLYSYAQNNPMVYVDPNGHDDVAAAGCNGDQQCLQVLLDQRGTGTELLSGFGKGIVNGFIATSNLINFTVDLAIAGTGLTDFQFGQIEPLPMTETEQVGSVIGDVGVALLTAGESLLGRTAQQAAVAGTRSTAQSTEVVQRAMSSAELAATRDTGLIRGGRSGPHFVSDAVNNSASGARQRLALPGTPEVKATLEVPAGRFSKPSPVGPLHGMRGGGTERFATGPVPVRILKVKHY